MNTKRLTNYSIANILGLESDDEQQQQENNLDLLKTNQTTKNRARRARTNFSSDAINYLEEIFKVNQYPDINEREVLAHKIDTSEARIQVWFQNKRSRHRKTSKTTPAIHQSTDSSVSSSNDSLTSNDSSSCCETSPKMIVQTNRIPFTSVTNYCTYYNQMNFNCY